MLCAICCRSNILPIGKKPLKRIADIIQWIDLIKLEALRQIGHCFRFRLGLKLGGEDVALDY